jgi:Fic family protein
MSIYVYEHKKWPEFHWDQEKIAFRLAEVRYRQGRLLGRMEGLPVDLQNEANLRTLALDVQASGEIDGELPDPAQVTSLVEIMKNEMQDFSAPLTMERLSSWHAALFPQKRPTRVSSGKIHFQAPHAHTPGTEIRRYLDWFNAESCYDPIIKAAIGHWWFVTIHPFAHGNGRIARALTEMQLCRADGDARRYYSMSAQIRAERRAYNEMIKRLPREKLNITSWIKWFLDCLDRSIADTGETLAAVRYKARFWEKYPAVSFNDRQRMMLNKLLDGFTGRLTSSQWAMLTGTSQDSAGRDITDLVQRGILAKLPGGGRSTSYLLVAI